MSQSCIFCRIIAQEVPAKVIARTEDLIVIQDISPKAPIHYLIIPLKHTRDIAALQLADTGFGSHLLLMAQQLAQDLPGSQSFRLVMNNGSDSGQSVFHLHAHFLSGKHMLDL